MATGLNQHKRLAMTGKIATSPQNLAKGGVVIGTPSRKGGVPDSPLEMVKRQNGIPGLKKGGKC